MNGIADILQNLMEADNSQDGDYRDAEGFLVCGKCHTRKQSEIDWPLDGSRKRVLVLCKCEKEKRKAEEEADRQRKFKEHIAQLRKDGISDAKYYDFRFELDDGKNPKITRVCKNYVENWQEMKQNNIGILFYGSVGTGKTFMACCIANALLEKMVPTSVTNFPRVLNRLQGFGEEKQGFIDRLQRYDLLVIDDLGVERNTQYAAEQVYNVIDSRSRSGKPLIITTNLSIEEMERADDLQYRRIYDRIMEMCPVRIAMTGPSKRAEKASDRYRIAKELLKD